MKKLIVIFVLFFIASLSVFAQKSTPMVDYKGHILNGKNQIGSITSEGSFDQAGKSMTKVDGKGNIVDSNGKIIGTAPKNSTLISSASFFPPPLEKILVISWQHGHANPDMFSTIPKI